MSRATDQFDAKVKTIIATARAAADQACKQFEGKDEGPCGFGYVVFPPGQRKLINSFKRLNQAEGEDLNRLTGYSPYGAPSWNGGWRMCPDGAAKYTQSIWHKDAYVTEMVRFLMTETDLALDCYVETRLD